jgi:hypothetical protein
MWRFRRRVLLAACGLVLTGGVFGAVGGAQATSLCTPGVAGKTACLYTQGGPSSSSIRLGVGNSPSGYDTITGVDVHCARSIFGVTSISVEVLADGASAASVPVPVELPAACPAIP